MNVPVRNAEESFVSFSRHIGDMMHEMSRAGFCRYSRAVGWQPAINVYEDDRYYYVCAELAGLSKNQIRVDVIGKEIRIYGERAAPPPPHSEGGCILRMEINYGPFERVIELVAVADMDSVTAKLVDGFLWITVAKSSI